MDSVLPARGVCSRVVVAQGNGVYRTHERAPGATRRGSFSALETSGNDLSWCWKSRALSEKRKGEGTILFSNVLFFSLLAVEMLE